MSDLLYSEVPIPPKAVYSKGDWKAYAIHDIFNIKGFFGDEAGWLSNFYPCKVWFEGLEYPSTEHAYQAAKVIPALRQRFLNITAAESKLEWKKAHSIELIPHWDDRKIAVMQEVVFTKFFRHKSLQTKLINTGNRYLEETNHWKDTYWGVAYDTGKGENMLGKILMLTRDYFRSKHFIE